MSNRQGVVTPTRQKITLGLLLMDALSSGRTYQQRLGLAYSIPVVLMMGKLSLMTRVACALMQWREGGHLKMRQSTHAIANSASRLGQQSHIVSVAAVVAGELVL
jgi:hypothetical protein